MQAGVAASDLWWGDADRREEPFSEPWILPTRAPGHWHP